ncbi:putative 3-isopropylmalate dehydrogenase [Helianthus annuus]|nr:putative 3-isopropylmalate dehydrogenase [Helianthus annuus]KAJ0632582.1 putative 3-isopropylmalate dehydrogenase [Helianthus annuus]KAJ0826490.1 putative 3-isopropylmalate dehydrogenase [Helianthus annuus]
MALHIAKRLLRTRATTPVVTLFSAVDRSFSSTSSDLIRAILFPCDGIGPKIAESVKQVLGLETEIGMLKSLDLQSLARLRWVRLEHGTRPECRLVLLGLVKTRYHHQQIYVHLPISWLDHNIHFVLTID